MNEFWLITHNRALTIGACLVVGIMMLFQGLTELGQAR